MRVRRAEATTSGRTTLGTWPTASALCVAHAVSACGSNAAHVVADIFL